MIKRKIVTLFNTPMTLLDTSVLTDHLFPIQLGNYRLEFSLNPDTVMYIPYSYIYGSHQEHNVNKGKNDTLINNRLSKKTIPSQATHTSLHMVLPPPPGQWSNKNTCNVGNNS